MTERYSRRLYFGRVAGLAVLPTEVVNAVDG
jgi:hypothetical protein